MFRLIRAAMLRHACLLPPLLYERAFMLLLCLCAFTFHCRCRRQDIGICAMPLMLRLSRQLPLPYGYASAARCRYAITDIRCRCASHAADAARYVSPSTIWRPRYYGAYASSALCVDTNITRRGVDEILMVTRVQRY